ncbi:hypothetical protein SASPL_118820 [Salvia splendens]|uniref:non-specific serine/threonine protein kinase n=1 Tax=Salvia splendens TaxID=180675 RepID=A0A8X8Y241_SALSN|nr:hypothetical protein SASPL_118820 [Salvia splendens]
MVVALLPLSLFSSILLSQLRVLIKAVLVMVVTRNCAVLISRQVIRLLFICVEIVFGFNVFNFTWMIAVKRLKSWSNKAEVEFSVEVEILARVRHKNLLTLRGYCAEGQERLIVYDYMTNLSLLSHLHGQHSAESHLDWTRRMCIALGAAEGIVSTIKRPITDWALPLACERKFSELADARLDGLYNEEELKRLVFIGLICAHNQPEKRPTMLEVVELIKGDKEKFAALESDEMFKSPPAAEDSCESVSDEEQKQDIENVRALEIEYDL